jgi:osmoprotectant transport system ATP-binding protein
MIIARNLSKTFNETEAVRNISFEVQKGQTLVLLGTSGCGKTTTLKMLNRLIEVSSGEITLDGEDITTYKPEILRRHIGYVSQNNGLFPHYTVAENIAIVPKLLSWGKDRVRQRSGEVMDQIQLPFHLYADKYPDELSGGQRQRVALARALVSEPPVLLMDEPFGALDPITRADIRKEFKEITGVDRKTIVLVTHDVQEAFDLGDRICLMDKGEIVQMGTARELIFKPKTDFVKNFFRHQQMQLELSALSFYDIWEQLPETSLATQSDLQMHQTLWQGMEMLSASNRKTMTLMHDGQSKAVSLAAITAAYGLLKNSN